jgi:RNA polymerase sigma factor (sigma-70 family)
MTERDTDERLLEQVRRWRAGDRRALEELLDDVEPWLRQELHRAMRGSPVNAQDSADLTQQALLNFLETGPRFEPKSGAQLRALLRRIAMNELVDQSRRAKHRDGLRFGTLFGSASVAGAHDRIAPSVESPSRVASFGEEWNWLRLALQFLEPDDRRLLIASEVEGASWAAIAEELALPSADAARVRALRLKPRLANYVAKLKAGRTPEP